MTVTADSVFSALAAASYGAYAVTIDQTIVFWNRAAERILGHKAEDVLGHRCYQVAAGMTASGLTPECLGGCPSIRYLRAGLVPSPARVRLLCSSGERKWVAVTSMVIAGVQGNAPVIVHLFDDSTEIVDSASESVREALTAGGADIISESPELTEVQGDAPTLSRRELEVLRLVARGWETPRIAAELGISRHTVRNHIRNLRQRLNASTKLDAVMKGLRLGILHAP